jgi:hypothetical protein
MGERIRRAARNVAGRVRNAASRVFGRNRSGSTAGRKSGS